MMLFREFRIARFVWVVISLLMLLMLSTVYAQTPEFRVLNWQGYGSDEPWAVAQFEERYGVRVVHDYFTSPDEMLIKLRTSPGVYDVVQMNIAYLKPAVEEGLIQPIDTSLILSWEFLPSEFRELPELSQGTENIYAISMGMGGYVTSLQHGGFSRGY